MESLSFSWGCWDLDQSSRQCLGVRISPENHPCLKLLNEVRKQRENSTAWKQPTMMNDYLDVNFMRETEPEVSQELAVYKSDPKVITKLSQAIIEKSPIVSKCLDSFPNNAFPFILQEIFNSLQKIDNQIAFIILLHDNQRCQQFLNNVILKLINSNDFYYVIECLAPVLHNLNIDTIIWSLKDKNSIFITQPDKYFQKFIVSLSDSQRLHFLNTISEKNFDLEAVQLPALEIILEHTLVNDRILENLINSLSSLIQQLSSDRCMGKILISIIKAMSISNTPNLINDVSILCNQFNGLMKTRIKNELKQLM